MAPRNPEIANVGRHVAQNRSLDTKQKIIAAMEAIEAEINANGGIYPHGRLCQAAVLKTAGVNSAYLAKPKHADLRDSVNQWVEDITSKIARGAKDVRRAVTDRVDAANEEVEEFRQLWVEEELKYQEARKAFADESKAKDKRITELEAEVAVISRQNAEFLSGGKIVSINARKKKDEEE